MGKSLCGTIHMGDILKSKIRPFQENGSQDDNLVQEKCLIGLGDFLLPYPFMAASTSGIESGMGVPKRAAPVSVTT